MKHINLDNVVLEHLPFKHFWSLATFFDGCDQEIYEWLEKSYVWDFTKSEFYTQFEFSLMERELPKNLEHLITDDSIKYISNCFIKQFGLSTLDLIGATVHKLIDGHKIGVHNDFIGGEETHRLVIQINPNWSEVNGGYLMLFNSQRSEDVAKVIKPLNNSCFGFEISPNSFHAVSKVYDFTRYTLVYTFIGK